LDVVSKDLSVTLCSALAQTFAAFTTCDSELAMNDHNDM